MKRCLPRSLGALALAGLLACAAGYVIQPAHAQTDVPAIPGYRTVDQAITARIGNAGAAAARAPGYLGIHAVEDGDGKLIVEQIEPGSPAATAGFQQGDLLLRIFQQAISAPDILRSALQARFAGDAVEIDVLRDKSTLKLNATLAPTSKVAPGKVDAAGGGWNKGGAGKAWKKPTYKLAIIGIEYTDVKHNAAITTKHWEDSMFSLAAYNKTSATGQKVHGSMHDYYKEQSFNKLKIEGKMFEWVQVSKKRMDYAQGNANKTALFNETCEKLLARDGKDALNDFDGVFFLFAGGRANVPRGSLYWPHRSNFKFQGKSWPYFIVQEGGEKMNDISVFCHEFGHMLGLPDLYARPENPGSEGVGQWCAMSNQVGGGKPQHFCAWSKEQLGWVNPCVIDPNVKQKLILSPIEDSPRECFKVLARADGSEYFLLENRKKKGFDASLPGEGLLIWRVVGNRPILEESHGVEGPSGPRVYLDKVPFPSAANSAFTPLTTPSSRSQLGGGFQVHITNIRRLPDGRITFHIGYDYL
jgi:M6 family metalloprotease-like protein